MNECHQAYQCAKDGINELPNLPCRVDEMTPREYQIYLMVAMLTGRMMFIRDLLKNVGDPDSSDMDVFP